MRETNSSNERLMNIKNRLREAIVQSGIKQNVIAKEIGVSAQTISKYLKTDVMPGLDTLARLCILLDVSADYILGIKEF